MTIGNPSGSVVRNDLISQLLNDSSIIQGTNTHDSFVGGAGNDRFYLAAGNDRVDGGQGIDTILYLSDRSVYDVEFSGSEVIVSTFGYNPDILTNVERLLFEDGSIALDTNGNAGQAYRIYKAAFDRAPDEEGLGHWIRQMDNGLSLETVAQGFVNSAEFASLYGVDPTNQDFIANLYRNVLDRELDQSGFDYWQGQMAAGMSRAQVVAHFSESAENQAATAPLVDAGIWFV